MSAIRMNNPRKRRKGRGNPFISKSNALSLVESANDLKRLAKDIRSDLDYKSDNPRNIVHFPRTKKGRPSKGRPRKLKHTGEAVFFSDFEKKRKAKKKAAKRSRPIIEYVDRATKRKRGRPKRYDYWICDAYIKGILVYTYIGAGARKDAVIEAQAMLGRHVPTMGKVLGDSGVIDKVELSGPYDREDGKPDPTWPRI